MAPNLYGNTMLMSEAKNCDNNDLLSDKNNSFSDEYTNSIQTTSNQTTNNVTKIKEKEKYKIDLVWRNIIAFIYLHFGAIYSVFLVKSWYTIIFAYTAGFASGFGITGGAHRLFAHKAYKANRKMRIMLMIFQTMAFQNSIYEWVRDHRAHHKFTDTNGDPHNATRGFFFSHIGWLMCKKHPDVKAKGSKIDMSDLEADPIIMFQHRNYMILMPIFCFLIPTLIPMFFWGETFKSSWYVASIFRYTVSLNVTWLINSAAHIWGMKPFDKDIKPTDTYIIGFLAFGEGWHNYHHVFPWDYKVSELPRYWCNFSIAFIDFFAWLGWATDLKTVSDEMVKKRVLRTGDGTHRYSNEENNDENNDERDVEHFWGYGDGDMIEEDLNDITILHKKYDT
ncbi:unnamed protein product [Diamesa serratosioi]